MLSVLIPTYNYSAYSLVKKIHSQCTELKIAFEILVSEDGGVNFIHENRQISDLSYCRYIENKVNVGRARNKNLLLDKSKYDLRLMLDSDVYPTSDDFIDTYINFSKKHERFVCFGGLHYEKKEDSNHCLRFNYGIKRECREARERNGDPFALFLTSNTLIKNCNQRFNPDITKYGFEEVVFADQLKNNAIPVFHMDNTVIHQNVESNQEFIRKTQEGLITLIDLEKSKTIKKGRLKLSKLYHFFSNIHLKSILVFSFEMFKEPILRQLLKKGGPVWLFDIYRLLYFSKHY
jgi:glycosyltransferase involved in cell wall biosynthesis